MFVQTSITNFGWNICRCVEQINKANRGEISQDELQERQVSILRYTCAFSASAASDSVLLTCHPGVSAE